MFHPNPVWALADISKGKQMLGLEYLQISLLYTWRKSFAFVYFFHDGRITCSAIHVRHRLGCHKLRDYSTNKKMTVNSTFTNKQEIGATIKWITDFHVITGHLRLSHIIIFQLEFGNHQAWNDVIVQKLVSCLQSFLNFYYSFINWI